jgi:hypothetical protein
LAIEACGQPITLDVAAAEWNHKCERYFTEQQDGLKQTWDAKAGWCNPPYSAAVIERFVRKAIDAAAQHGTTTICLLPWWNYPYMDLCERHGRVHRICSPVSFQRQDGTAFVMNSYYSTTQLVVVVFGPTVTPGFGAPIRKDDTTGKTDVAANADSGKRGRKVVGAMPPHRANLQNTETPPSLCMWISERLEDADVHPKILLDPCAGRGNLTRPLRGRAQVIEYEISRGRDFFEAKGIACDLVICNPPWSEAERWLRHIVKVVGNQTPMVLILPTVFFEGYKNAPVRRYLESPEAPQLSNYTPLPSDTFVRVYNNGCICWFNLPRVRNVAFVPSRYLIRCNDIDTEVAAMERNI